MENKSKKSNKNIILLILIAIVALVAIVVFFVLGRHQNEDIPNTEEELSSYLDEDQKEIFDKIYNAKNASGVYTYKVTLGGESIEDEKVYTSGDDRMLSVISGDSNAFQIFDGKYLYNASEKYKTFYKKEIKYKVTNENKSYLDYNNFFNDTDDVENRLINGLIIEKDGDNYIIKNDIVSYVFDKDYVMIQDKGTPQGMEMVKKLIDYDDDFDKYYNEYFEKMKLYEEVDDINKVSPK